MKYPGEFPVLLDVKFVAVLLLLATALSAETTPLRVLSWNLHHGVGGDGKLDLERIAKVIRDANPDLVALQEVDNQCARSGKIDQTAELARLTGMTGVFGKAMNYDGGGYGQAILSRHPILSNQVHPLPSSDEPRIAFEAVVTIDGKETRFLTVHLDLDDTKRLAQSELIAKLHPNSPQPAILCGDFNTTPASPALEAIKKSWDIIAKKEPAFTCPADKPDTEIDHVFTRGMSAASPVIVLPEATASDHRPIFAELIRK